MFCLLFLVLLCGAFVIDDLHVLRSDQFNIFILSRIGRNVNPCTIPQLPRQDFKISKNAGL